MCPLAIWEEVHVPYAKAFETTGIGGCSVYSSYRPTNPASPDHMQYMAISPYYYIPYPSISYITMA